MVDHPETRFTSNTDRMVREEQIQQWADKAEAGYDVEDLKGRRPAGPRAMNRCPLLRPTQLATTSTDDASRSRRSVVTSDTPRDTASST